MAVKAAVNGKIYNSDLSGVNASPTCKGLGHV